MPSNLLFAARETAIRKERIANEPIPLDDLFRTLFGVTLTQLNERSERGELAKVSRDMAGLLRLKNVASLKHWHEVDETGTKVYFKRIPEDRLATLTYYYHGIMPHHPIRAN